MKTTLSTLPVGRFDAAEVPLKRLFMGQPVMFELRGHFLPRRLGRNPVLMIVPVSHFVPTAANGLDLVVSVEGRGCWVCAATPSYSVHDLYRAGVPMLVAVELATKLNSLLQELKHG